MPADPLSSANQDERLQADLIDRIDRSPHGKLKLKVRTLMEMFGYRAVQRLRQSSLLEVKSLLATWSIEASLPNEATASDWVTLSRGAAPTKHPAPPPDAQPRREEPRAAAGVGDDIYLVDPRVNAFAFAFDVVDVHERDRSVAICHDLFAAVWLFQPICLHLNASDELFCFAAGFISALMRRRSRMLRRAGVWGPLPPIAPEILSLRDLKAFFKRSGDDALDGRVVFEGAVYLVRDLPDDLQDDDLIASVREMFIPHTYRLRARFVTTTAEPGTGGRRARDDDSYLAFSLQPPPPALDSTPYKGGGTS